MFLTRNKKGEFANGKLTLFVFPKKLKNLGDLTGFKNL